MVLNIGHANGYVVKRNSFIRVILIDQVSIVLGQVHIVEFYFNDGVRVVNALMNVYFRDGFVVA